MVAAQPNTDLSLVDAADYFPRRRGKKVHVLTIRRWILDGVKGVQLDGWKYGNEWYTNATAIGEFRAACTAASGRLRIQGTSTESLRDAEEAQERLRRKGLYGAKARKGSEAAA